MRRLVIMEFLTSFYLWGCAASPTTPVEVYRAFHNAVSSEDWDMAMTFLNPKSKKLFTKVGGELQEIVGDKGDSLDFFLRGIRAKVGRPLLKIQELESHAEEARLRVVAGKCGEDAGESECIDSEVHLVRISGRWYIDPVLPTLFGESKPEIKVPANPGEVKDVQPTGG